MASAFDSVINVGDDTGLILSTTTERKARRNMRRVAKKAKQDKTKRLGRSAGFGAAPWIVTLVVAAIAGFGGYYLFEKLAVAERALSESRAESAGLVRQAADADDRAMAVQADLTRAQDQLSSAKVRAKQKAAAADELASRLEEIVGKDQGELRRDGNGQLTLQLMDKVLFHSGEAELTDRGRAVLAKVGEAFNKFPDKQIWVQGHTDDVPITKTSDLFASNWELSAIRAVNVVHYLEEDARVDPRRLAAVAFSKFRPVSRKWKSKNRRIEIVLFPKKVRVVQD